MSLQQQIQSPQPIQETEDSAREDQIKNRILQDKIHNLEADVERLTFEIQEMHRKGVSAKKEQ